jgi:hypothetical protein
MQTSILTDEEIRDIRNRAKLNDNRQIDPLLFARDIERAVIEKMNADDVLEILNFESSKQDLWDEGH